MSKTDHFGLIFSSVLSQRAEAIKKLKVLLRNHLLQFPNEKPFSEHSFGPKFELIFSKKKFSNFDSVLAQKIQDRF